MTRSFGAGYKPESAEARALKTINTDSYDYRDQTKLLTKLTGDVTYMAQYMRTMQKGIDDANQNFIEQIQQFINEIGVLLSGHGNTGFDFGDLKYIFQAIGALFGFDEQTGLASVFPINLFDAAWHFFSTYILQLGNFKDRIDAFIDTAIATILDMFGEIPIVGQALQKLATWILDFRDAVRNGQELLGGIFSDWTQSLVDSVKETIEVIKDIVEWFTGQRQSVRIKFLEWAQRLPIMNALNGTILGNNIPNLDASKISTGQFDQGRITNLTNSLAGKAEVSAYKLRAKAGLNLVISPNFDQTLPAILRCTYNGNVWTSTGYTAVQSKNGMTSWTWTANGTNQEGVRFAPTELDYAIDVVPGETYYVEAYYFAKSTNSSAAGYLQIGAEFNNSVAGIGVVTVNNSAITKGQWNQISGYFQVPANATEAYVWICSSSNTPNGNVYYVDAVVLKEVTDSSKIKQGLFNSNTVLPTVLASVVPSLDASKVTTGTLGTGLIPTLPQSKIQDLTAELSTLSIQRADNFASNPGFENSNFPVQCFYGRSVYSTAVKRNGTQSIKTTGVEGIWPLYNYRQATEIPVAQGDTFYAEIWVYPATTNVNTDGHIDLTVYTNPGGPTGSFIDANDYPAFKDPLGGLLVNNIPKGQWTKLSGYYTVPAGVSTIKLLCYVSPYVPGSSGTQDTNNIYYWDDPAIYRVTETEKINKVLFNESEPSSTVLASAIPGFDASKIISGTMADDRVAFLRENFATLKISLRDAENLVADGSFEYDPVPWDIDPSGDVYNGFAIDSTVARSGTRSLKIDNNFYAITYCNGWTLEGFAPGTYGNPTPRWVTVSPGEKIYVEFWARRTTAYVDQAPTGNFADSSAFMVVGPDQMAFADPATGQGTYIYFSALQVPTANTWTKISKVITIPSSGVDRISFKIMGPITLGGFAWIDDIVVRRVLSTERFADNSIGNNKISDISGDKVNAGTVGAGYIAPLDASKITTGTLGTSIVPNLDATKITTGTLGTSRIPSLDATKITTGTLSTTTIPNLDAGKITTGTLATTTIPNLDAGKITTGTLAGSTIPALDASKVTTGNFAQNRVTNLTTDLAAKLSQAVYSAKAKAGVNLIPAPSFEITTVSRFDYRTGTWSTSGYSTEQKRTGLRSWKWTTDAGNWNGIRLTPTEYDTTFDVVAGEKYYVELWYYAPSTNTMTAGTLAINAHGYAGGVYTTGVAFTGVANTVIVTNQWNKLSGYGTIPAGIDSISPYILSDNSTPAGNVYYIDDVVFKEATESTGIKQGLFGSNSVLSNILTAVVPSLDASKVTTGTFAATTIPALDAAKVTTGTFGTGLIPNLDAAKVTTGSFLTSLIPALDASKVTTGNFAQSRVTNLTTDLSTIDGKAVVAQSLVSSNIASGSNLVANPDFENANFYMGGSNISFSTEQKRYGTKSLKMTGNGSTVIDYYVTNDNASVYVKTPASSGDWFYMEVWVYGKVGNVGGGNVQFYISCYDSTDTAVLHQLIDTTSATVGTGTWVKMSGTFQAPANTVWFNARLRLNTSVPATDSYYFDSVVIREVTTGTATNKVLFNSTSPLASILSSIIPSLDASKVSTGTFGTGLIPSLDAAKITTGSFLSSLIPTLDAAKIGTGSFLTSLIPALDASKVTTGNFAQSRVTNLTTDLGTINTTTGRLSAVTARRIESQANIVTDPACSQAEVWTYYQNCSLAVSTEQFRSSPSSVKMGITNSAYPGFNLIQDGTATWLKMPCVEGDVFYAECYVRAKATNVNTKACNIQFLCHDTVTGGADYAAGTWANTASVTPTSTGWTKISGYYTVPAGRDKISIWFWGSNNSTVGDSYYIDDIQVQRVTEANKINKTIFNSDTPLASLLSAVIPSLDASKIGTGTFGTGLIPALDAAKITTGTFAQSFVSNLTTDLKSFASATGNYAWNPGFENTNIPLGMSGAAYSTDVAHSGTQSVKITSNASSAFTYLTPADNFSGKNILAQQGDIFYCEIWVYGKATNVQTTGGTNGIRMVIDWRNAASANVGSSVGYLVASTALNGVWTKLSFTSTAAPANTCAMKVYIELTSVVTSGEVYYVDDAFITRITEVANTNTTLFNSKTPLSNILSAVIPSLDASKVSTGTFGTGLIPALDAAKVTTGSFLSSLIPALDASKVTTGNFAQSRITGFITSLATKNNVVSNPGFENTSMYLGGIGVYSTELPRSGTQSIKFTGTGNNAWAVYLLTTDTTTYRMSVSPGDVIYMEFWVCGAATNTQNLGAFYLYAQGYDGAGNNVENTYNGYIAVTTALNGTWTKVSGYRTMTHADIRTVAIGIYSTGIVAGEIYYIDDPVVRVVTDASNINTTLFNNKTPLANILSAVVPSLDASKVSTGTFGTGLIPSLDAAKVTTGSFLTSLIPALDASKVTTGNFAQSRVTNLTTDFANTNAIANSASAAGANLVTNVGFESNLFYASGGSWSTEQAYTGTQSWKYTHANVANWTAPFFTTITGSLRRVCKPDDVYYVEFMVYPHASNAAGTSTTVRFYMRVEDKTGAQISTPGFYINTAAMTKGAWNKASGYITLDGNAANTYIQANIAWGSTEEGTNTYYFDNPIIYRITEAANTNQTLFNSKTPLASILSSIIPTLDGSKIGTGTIAANFIAALDAAKIATGTFLTGLIPALDASKVTTGTLGTGLIPNITKAMSTDLNTAATTLLGVIGSGDSIVVDGGYEYGSVKVWSGFSRSTEQAHTGTYSLKVTGNLAYISQYAPRDDTNILNYWCNPGDVFYMEVWVYGHASNVQNGSGAIYMGAGAYTQAGALINYPLAASVTVSTSLNSTWTKLSGYVTAPANTARLIFYYQLNNLVQATETFYFDDFNVRPYSQTATVNNALYGQLTPLSNVLSSVVPALDAAKITTGTFSNAMIASGLDAAKLTTGTLPTARIGTGAITNTYLGTDIDGSKIGAGSVAAARIAALDAAKITTGTFGNAFIGTNAIATANLQDTAVTGAKTAGLDGSKITTGTIAESVIASLSASKIGSGLLDLLRIPSLPTSQITSGTFGTAFIADGAVTGVKTAALDASKVTTGTMAQAQVTSLTTDLGNRVDYTTYGSFLSGGTANLCSNPGFEDSSQFLYNGTYNTNATYVRSGARSAAMVGNGTQKYLAILSNKTAEIYTQGYPSAKYYYEFYVKGDAANTLTGSSIVVNCGVWSYTAGLTSITSNGGTGLTADQVGKTNWVKCSGYITTTSDATTAKHRFLIYIPAAVTTGNTYYIDDVWFEDVTDNTAINTTLFNQNTPGTSILSGVVPGLDAAKITTGTFSNAMIASGLDAAKLTTGTLPVARIGASAITNAYLGSDIDGSKIGAGSVAAARIAALDAAKITTGTFGNAFIGLGAIGTTNIQDLAITGAKTTGLDGSKITTGTIAESVIATLSASKIGSGILDILRVPDLSTSKITSGTFGGTRIASGAVTDTHLGWDINGGKIGYGTVAAARIDTLDTSKITTGTFGTALIADGAITTAKIPDAAVTGVKTAGLDASKITGGTLGTGVLPSSLTSVGSGFLIQANSGASANVSCSPNTPGANKFASSLFNSTPSNTGDYTVTTGSELKITASNAGWYMVEIAFGIDQTNRVVGYRLAAALFKNGTMYKTGSTVDYYGSLSGNHPFCAQGSFIVYLNSTDYVSPGCLLYSQSTITAAPLVVSNFSGDTYFSVSLLNRSLA